MALGENPMSIYGFKGELPSTKMGIGYLFRQKFYEAAVLKQQQGKI